MVVMKKKKINLNKKGAILVLVLWALGLLTVFAVYLGVGVRGRIDFLDRMETRSKIYNIAEAAIKQAVSGIGNLEAERTYIALKDICSSENKIFSNTVFDGGEFTIGYEYFPDEFSLIKNNEPAIMYGVSDVQARLNINTAKRKEMIALFAGVADIDDETADVIASSIVDWRDADNKSQAHGAEDKYYRGLKSAYHCKNSSFEAVEELRYVKGMNYNIFEDIEPYITVFGTGRVNINTASMSVLKALGLSEQLAQKILAYRCGEDGVEASGDDKVFETVGSLVAKLSQSQALSASEVAKLSNIVASGSVGTFSTTFLIQAQASVDNKEDICQIKSVFEKDLELESKRAGLILNWQIDYFQAASGVD